MPTPSQRQLRYNVTLVGDTSQAQQAFQRVGQSADAVARKAQAAQIEVSRLNAVGGGGGGQAYGGGGGGGQAHGGGGQAAANVGGAGGLAKLATKLVAAAAVVEVVANLADAIGKLGDTMTGTREKTLNFFASIPILGEAITKLVKAPLDLIERIQTDMEGGVGTYDAKRRRLAMMPFDDARDDVRAKLEYRLGNESLSDSGLMSQAQVGSRNIAALNAVRFGDPSLRGSEKEFDAARRGARSSVINARGERDVARDRVAGGMAAANEQADVYNRARSASMTATAAATAGANQADKFGGLVSEQDLKLKLAEADSARSTMAREAARYEELIKKTKADSLALTQAESAHRKANIGLAQTELQIVNQKLDANKSATVQLANMEPAKQQAVSRALDRLNEKGFDELSPEQKQLLNETQATAEYVQKFAAKAGDGSPLIRNILQKTGMGDQATLKETQERLQKTVNVGFKVDAEELATAVQKAIEGPVGQAMRQALADVAASMNADIYLKQIGQKKSKQ